LFPIELRRRRCDFCFVAIGQLKFREFLRAAVFLVVTAFFTARAIFHNCIFGAIFTSRLQKIILLSTMFP
jgi:hypothetical protein